MEFRSGDRPVLSSWKEIAAYFDRDVRTVQRWEKEQDLPVHRHRHSRGTSVYAYEPELATWWTNVEHGAAGESALRPRWVSAWQAWAAVVFASVVLAVVVTGQSRAPSARSVSAMAGGSPAIAFTGAEAGPALGRVRTGDLDGDGTDDLILGSLAGGQVAIRHTRESKLAGGESTHASTILSCDQWPIRPDSVGDYDGDGIEDLIVTEVLDEETSYYRSSSMYLVLGRRDWPNRLTLPEDAEATLVIEQSPDVRVAVGPTADVDGDGIDDVLVRATEYRAGDQFSAGAVFVIHGRATWPGRIEVERDAGLSLVGSGLGHGFGAGLATGDFNGDGSVDIAVVASHSTLWNLGGSNGTVYLFAGRERWPARVDADEDAMLRVADTDHRMHSARVLLADVDGDARDDLILGQPGDWTLDHVYAGPGQPSFPGAIDIWLGSSGHRGSLARTDADITIHGLRDGGRFGEGMAAADLDGDGAAELVVAQPGHGVIMLSVRTHLLGAGTVVDHGAWSLFDAESSQGTWGLEIADIDGDMLAEILVATPDSATGGALTGRVWIVKPYLQVAADYRPLAHPNVVVPGGVGALRLDKLGGPAGEAIDPATVRIGGVAPLSHVERDYDEDGVLEVQVWIENDRLSLVPGLHRIAITGRTRSGLLLGGSELVDVLPPLPTSHPGRRPPGK